MISHMPPVRCPYCNKLTDAATGVDDDRATPGEGDVCICFGCASILIYARQGGRMTTRKPTRDELFELRRDQTISSLRVHLLRIGASARLGPKAGEAVSKTGRIPTMRDVERHGYAVFPDDAVDALLGPMPPGVRREDTRPYHPETWPPDKPGLEYLHRALARRLIAKLRRRAMP